MRKILLVLAATAVLCVPAVSVAGDSSRSRSPKPTAETHREGPESHENNPAGACKSDRNSSSFATSHNGQTFDQFYGVNRAKGRGADANALGKCVSGIAKHTAEHDGDESTEGNQDSVKGHSKGAADSHGPNASNPAMSCKAMQANAPSRFETTYGTPPNAFGKCVSSQASRKDG